MAGYRPLYISGNETGLVQEREEFLLPNDAYPFLENAYVWRERIRRRQGLQLLGRLRRILTAQALGNTVALQTTYTFNTLFSSITPAVGALEPDKAIEPGTLVITIGPPDSATFTDNGDGTFAVTGAGVALGSSVNYSTGVVTIVLSVAIGLAAITAAFNYFPNLPVMGLRQRVLNGINVLKIVAFDTKYAYIFNAGFWQEFIPGVTWTGSNSQFFWSTNYFTNAGGINIFWVTNFNDPIRFTDGTSWANFSPQINAAGDLLNNCLCMLPYRGRLVVANTRENGQQFAQRIRWAAIGTPFTVTPAVGFPGNIAVNVNVNAWRDDIRGQGGFLDVPTSDPIVSIGFVRDNMVVYCENTTWQLRYTGRSIAPFSIERVNSELGAKATFSTVQFDTSLLGIGDKGVVECDSFKADRIDIKIPDLVFEFSDDNNGTTRVHGVRDFQQRLAYWTYPYFAGYEQSVITATANIFPNRRLVYNYENDSWAIFTDSLTCFGSFNESSSETWANSLDTWAQANFPWISVPPDFPQIIAGNQQGFVMIVGGNLQPKTTNEITLFIKAITGNDTTPTVITSPNHNLVTGQVISITDIPVGTPFASTLNNPLTGSITGATRANPCVITSASHNLITGYKVTITGVNGMVELNGNTYTITVIDANTFSLNGVDSTNFGVFSLPAGTWTSINTFRVQVIDADTFQLFRYDPLYDLFDLPQLDPSANIYTGGGTISVRDNFSITSKKFNALDSGQQLQIGYIDILTQNTASGAFTLNIYMNYNNSDAVNQPDENSNPVTALPDPFFNTIIPTDGASSSQKIKGNKNLYRAFCPVRGQFLTLEYTLSNGQLAGIEQESDVQIDMQILWQREAGRLI